MIRYALLATIIGVVTTSSFLVVFRHNFVIPVASAAITAIIINFLWWRSRKRPPTYREKTILILGYWFLTAALIVVPTIQFVHTSTLAMVLLNTSIYPITMLVFFGISEKLNGQVERAMIFCMVIGALLVIAMTFYHGFLKISEILG